MNRVARATSINQQMFSLSHRDHSRAQASQSHFDRKAIRSHGCISHTSRRCRSRDGCQVRFLPRIRFQPASANGICCETEERPRPSGGNCDECHSVMQPKSHTIRWRSDLHGRMAAMNRMNCTVCHQSDFCIRCHDQRPRSHNPINAFVNGGHRFLAQVNQRSCFVCHDYAQTCQRSHSPTLRE